MTRALVVLAAASVVASPALTQSVEFSGTAQVRGGYGSNPFLQPGRNKAVAVLGGTISPQLTRRTGRGVTTLAGSYDRTEYLSDYDHSDTALVSLSHEQQVSERVSLSGNIAYVTSTNPFVSDITDTGVTDLLTVGQRSRRLYGGITGDWTPTARDSITVSLNASHATFNQRTTDFAPTSDYDQVGGQVRYLRTLGPRTKVGVQVGVSSVDSKSYADSQAYQPSLVLTYQINDHWLFDGSAGVIFQHRDSAPPVVPGGLAQDGGWTKSIGFNASLCGDYPRHRLCLTGSRDSTPSGFGGLRRTTLLGVDWTYTISPRSRLNVNGSYQLSDGSDFILPTKDRFGQAGVDYSHDLTQRISVGAGANYQWRDLGRRLFNQQRSARAFTATAKLTYRFGRLGV